MGGPAFCRDCLTDAASRPSSSGPLRCCACGSPRVLAHPEIDRLAIAHIDCDAFYAAIEKRDDPSLADRPVIVGGAKRGVVATACYVARTYGIHSAMPMFKALKACPHAVVIRPNMEKYARVGRQIREMMRALTPLVEPISIDEAFLDLSGTERLHHAAPALTLAQLARRVETEVGLTVSVGLSYNKFLAKVASDLQKPRGFSIIGREDALAFLGDKPISLVPGIGRSAEERLARLGLRTIADLRTVPASTLVARLGKEGARLHHIAFGIDERRVNPQREAKSVSAETTFEADIAGLDALEPVLWRLCERVSHRLKAAELAGCSITLKLKAADFKLRTRSRSGLPPTQLAKRLYETGRELLAAECDGTAFRLIGIGASDLCDAGEADRGDLADLDARRDALTERAIDSLRTRFGDKAIVRGIALRDRRR